MILFSSIFHQGFNLGFNIAESVNFATPEWIDVFKKVKQCTCQKDNFKINIDIFLENISNSKEYKNLIQNNKEINNNKYKKIKKNKRGI